VQRSSIPWYQGTEEEKKRKEKHYFLEQHDMAAEMTSYDKVF